MSPSLVEIRSVTSEIRCRKKEETTAVKYKPFGIVMPCGLMSNALGNRRHHVYIASLLPISEANQHKGVPSNASRHTTLHAHH